VYAPSAERSTGLPRGEDACHAGGVQSRRFEHRCDSLSSHGSIATHVGWRAMGDRSTIEWTEATWNPVTGCDRVSPGCDHCYALTLAARLKAMGSPKYQQDGDPRTSGPGFGVTLHPDELAVPRRWRRPRRVFVNSMSDPSVGVGIKDPMIAAGNQHNPVSVLCPTSVADGSRRTTVGPHRLTRPRIDSTAKASSTGPVNRSPTRSSSPGKVSCPDSWRALPSSDTVACSA
jgi:hypothetical protein